MPRLSEYGRTYRYPTPTESGQYSDAVRYRQARRQLEHCHTSISWDEADNDERSAPASNAENCDPQPSADVYSAAVDDPDTKHALSDDDADLLPTATATALVDALALTNGATVEKPRAATSIESRRPFLLYGKGDMESTVGLKRTFNVTSENGVHASALRAKDWRRSLAERERRRLVSRSRQTVAQRRRVELQLAAAREAQHWQSEYQRNFQSAGRPLDQLTFRLKKCSLQPTTAPSPRSSLFA